MYEQFGVEGVKTFQKTVDYCHEKDLVVIGDVKRGDIGSTSAAYATGHLGKVTIGSKSYATFDEDFATVNPYLGTDGIKPFVDVCKEEKKGIFILVKTSNPSSGEFQDRLIDGRPLYEWVGEKVAEWGSDCMGDSYSYVGAVVGAIYPEQGKILRKVMPKSFILVKTSNPSSGEFQDRLIDGRPLYEWVGEKVAEWGSDCMGDSYSYVGAVVGATYPEQGKILRKVMPKSFILVPGYGAQGGKGADLVHFFNEDGLGAIVNSSRGIIAAYKQDKYKEMGITEENFADASRAAVEDMIADISGALAAR
jgi:orotidine-5'-phosphate decarboxylase